MMFLVGLACLLAFVAAEPPPSNSYLPPSGRSSNGGYSSGGPQVISARSSQGFGSNNFGRSGSRGQGQFGGRGYENGQGFGRNGGEPAQYKFGYNVNDNHGTDFGHHEIREDEAAHGEYHVVLPDGRKQSVNYEADERGFRPQISYEDSGFSGRNGGYDNGGY